jgi:hypothetical protein
MKIGKQINKKHGSSMWYLQDTDFMFKKTNKKWKGGKSIPGK